MKHLQTYKKWILFIALLTALGIATPALADYLGPNRTVTTTVSVCHAVLYECKEVNDRWKYKRMEDWSCPNGAEACAGYENTSRPCDNDNYTPGYQYCTKEETTETITTVYDPATALMFILAGCGRMALTVTPTMSPTAPILPTLPSPTTAPPYIHYASPKTPNVHLEFDYPGSWYFNDEKMQYTDTIVIYLGDPRVLTVPTRVPDEPHGTPSDFGSVKIWIDSVEPGQTLDSLVKEQKRIDSTARGLTPLDDYPIEIDGHDAYVLETLNDFPELYTSVMFNRRIFFIVYDQVYTIDFTIAEQERVGEFEKGYDYFFNSLKIVP